MEITSVELFETIRAFDWRTLQGWFNSNVKVSFPDKSGSTLYRLLFRLNGPRNLTKLSPQGIQRYITFGTTKGEHSPVEALFLQKGHVCTTNFSPDVLNTYYTLVSNGAATLTDHQAYGDYCLDPARNKPIIKEIDLYCLYKRNKYDNPYPKTDLKRYFGSADMTDELFNIELAKMERRIMDAIHDPKSTYNSNSYDSNSYGPRYGGRRTRQRRLRRTRRR
jgi:hypothetical protein